MSEEPTAKEIWDKLSRIDVSEKTQQKGGLSYLSWAWAWSTLMDNYPQAEYEFREFESPLPQHQTLQSCMFYPDGTGEVHCDVSVGEVRRYMWLPVMDFRNNAIANPNSREISDAKMRCLTKCISMLGLGSHIYQGEDIPRKSDTDGSGAAPAPDKKVAKKAPAKVAAKKANGAAGGVFYAHKAFIDQIETKEELIKHFEKNKAELAKLKKSKPDIVAKISQAFSEKMESFN